jgi:seryl-tRNA synthetase
MKHLKKFENKENDEFEEIRSILRDLKDEYTYMEGQIFPPKEETDLIEIHLDCENIFSEDVKKGTSKKGNLEYNKSKMEFIDLVIKTIERLELALGKKTFVQNLWNWDHWQDTKIKIFIYQ